MDDRDGGCTRRELLLRMLLLNAVLDQGPDIDGVREMMVRVVNNLYEKEVRIFHRPLDFFKEINLSVDHIWNTHETVKSKRSDRWARDNQTTLQRISIGPFPDSTVQNMIFVFVCSIIVGNGKEAGRRPLRCAVVIPAGLGYPFQVRCTGFIESVLAVA